MGVGGPRFLAPCHGVHAQQSVSYIYVCVKVHSFRRPVDIYSFLHYGDRVTQLLRNHERI
jgi:hypothetical protein